jgi:hypothetical protein
MTDPRDLIKRLADCLHEAADDVEGWGNYASSYFQEKHDLSGNVARIHAQAEEAHTYLAQPEPEGPTDEELRQLWRELYAFHDGPTSGDVVEIARAVLSRWGLPAAEPEGTITEPRGCPTPGACSCPTAPFAPPELIRALELAEAALADIGDAERESGDDLAWAEARAAQDLPRIRAVLARWGSQPSTANHSANPTH